MKHLSRIRSYLRTLCKSDQVHALVLLSAPGWAKSTTITEALADLGIEYVPGGAVATPLHVYNLLCRHPDSVIVLDDVSGLFEDKKAMSVLKAAAWAAKGDRRVAWGSTSDKVEQSSVVFRGKLILIANSITKSRETQAFLSRAIFYKMEFGRDEVTAMLKAAAASKGHFSNQPLAMEVADFLVGQLRLREHSSISLRTLHIGCELAATHPEEWRELLEPLLPSAHPDHLIESLATADLGAHQQERKFIAETGLSRRTFYREKKRLGMSRSYQRTPERKSTKK